MSDRRGFLRGLVSLPLIGGGVTLIGKPTAAAVPVTDALQERYLAFLAHEHLAAVREHKLRKFTAHCVSHYSEEQTQEYVRKYVADGCDYMQWFPEAPVIERIVASGAPSTRAAVILSAAGVPLT